MTAANNMMLGAKSYSGGNANGKIIIKNFTFQNTSTAWTQAQINQLYYSNTLPSGSLQWSMNNTNLDINGANGITLTGTSYVTNVPFQNRSLMVNRILASGRVKP